MKTLLLLAVALWSGPENEPIHLSSAAIQVTPDELNAEHERLMANWTGKIFTADFREVLRPQMDWKRQLTFATLLRYPGGPGSG
ncbi:MAG: hypothetical protein AAGA23_13475, partial [Pseudomonadota bacterium]